MLQIFTRQKIKSSSISLFTIRWWTQKLCRNEVLSSLHSLKITSLPHPHNSNPHAPKPTSPHPHNPNPHNSNPHAPKPTFPHPHNPNPHNSNPHAPKPTFPQPPCPQPPTPTPKPLAHTSPRKNFSWPVVKTKTCGTDDVFKKNATHFLYFSFQICFDGNKDWLN